MNDDEKIQVRNKIQQYLARGNPDAFLKRIGVLGMDGSINYERAKVVLDMTAAMEDDILKTFNEAGYEVKRRDTASEEDEGIISGGQS